MLARVLAVGHGTIMGVFRRKLPKAVFWGALLSLCAWASQVACKERCYSMAQPFLIAWTGARREWSRAASASLIPKCFGIASVNN